MKNILIPTDFSKNSWNAITYAIQFFAEQACNFYILHVDTVVNNVYEAKSLIAQNKAPNTSVASVNSKQLLKDFLLQIKTKHPNNNNHNFIPLTDNSSLVTSIRKHVETQKIDIIVMGTKGESIKNNSIGRNTVNVITKVKCNTLVIPEQAKYRPISEIVFPTDFSLFYQTTTLQPILSLIKRCKATIRVLSVTSSKQNLNDDQNKNKDYLEDHFSEFSHSFEAVVNKNLDCALEDFILTKNVNLIAMMAKNLNYFQKIFIKLKTDKVNYYKNIPLLVLH